MAKKKGKGKKGHRKDAKSKSFLSHLDRVKFELQVEILEKKIARKKKLCLRLEEEIDLYNAASAEVRNKDAILKILEKAIEKQIVNHKIYEDVFANAKSDVPEFYTNRMATEFMELDSCKASYYTELDALKKKFKVTENFTPNKLEQRIEELEKELRYNDSNWSQQQNKKKMRLEKYLQRNTLAIIKNEAKLFQGKIDVRLDPRIERVGAETKLRKIALHDLCLTADTLEKKVQNLEQPLKAERLSLKFRKEFVTDKVSVQLEKQKKLVSLLSQKKEILQGEMIVSEQFQKQIEYLDQTLQDIRVEVLKEKEKMANYQIQLRENDAKIKIMEEELSGEQETEQFLIAIFKQVKTILKQQVDVPDPPENAVLEIEAVLSDASKVLYGLKDPSSIVFSGEISEDIFEDSDEECREDQQIVKKIQKVKKSHGISRLRDLNPKAAKILSDHGLLSPFLYR